MSAREELADDHVLRGAQWIWPQGPYEVLHNVYADFRRVVELDEVPESVPLHITADAQYVLWINGTYVNRGPARGYQHEWPFDTHEFAPLLKPGKNVIAVRVHNPGRGTFQYRHEDAAGLLCAIELPDDPVVTDHSWQTRLDRTHARATTKLSVQLSYQEHVNLLLDDDWRTSPTVTMASSDARDSFAYGDDLGGDAADYAWHPPRTAWVFGHQPWTTCTPRDVPHLTGHVTDFGPPTTLGRGTGDAIWQQDPTRRYLQLADRLAWSHGKQPDTMPELAAGETCVLLFDLGRTRIGAPIVTLEPTGELIDDDAFGVDLLFVQAVDETGVPVFPRPHIRNRISMAARIRETAGGSWEAFQQIGLRYLAVVATGPLPPVRVKARLRETVYPLDVVGRFHTDDAEVDAIWVMCRETQRVCLTDAYTDTPWREQAQWWGDARVQAQNTFHLADDTRPLVRGIRSIAGQQLDNGLTYGHAPTCAHTCVLPDFSLVWLMTLRDHWWQTGDTSLLLEQWDAVKKVLEYFRTAARGDNGLLQYDRRYWLFLDWCDLHDTGTPTLLNLWHVWALAALAEICNAAGRHDDAYVLRAERTEQLQRIDTLLFDHNAGLFRDGLDDNDVPVQRHSIHNQTLALLAGVRDEKALRARVFDYLTGELHGGAAPSSYWVTYVYDAAEQLGMEHAMLDHIAQHWAPMLPHGGCFESFNTGAELDRETVSHAWAGHPLYHFVRALGGVRQTAERWDRVLFKPILDWPRVGKCDTVVPTPHGNITVAWERAGDVRLTLPVGVTADVELPSETTTVKGGTHVWPSR